MYETANQRLGNEAKCTHFKCIHVQMVQNRNIFVDMLAKQ
jgi:hypothetical protein